MSGMGLTLASGRYTETGESGFSPANVAAVAAGYYWVASDAVGLGTAGFNVPEGNRHTAFNLVQTTVASQPTVLTENGGTQFRMRKTADPNPSKLGTAGAVTAGWTGATYIAGWFRLPDASGDITGSNFLFNHAFSPNLRINASAVVSSGDKMRMTTSSTGANSSIAQWATVFTGAWVWLEWLITAAATIELDANFVVQSRLDAGGNFPLFDAAASISIGSYVAFNLADADTTDWAAVYYANGIPSLAERVALRNYRAPI